MIVAFSNFSRASLPCEQSLFLDKEDRRRLLSFDNHVLAICKKINNQLNVMLRFRKLINKETLLKLYKVLILPHFY